MQSVCTAAWHKKALSTHGGDQTYNIWIADLPDFRVDPLSDGDSIYSRENSFEILGTHVKMCLICTGPPVKGCWKFW